VTGTETRIHEALTAVAERRPVDVERLWHEFQTQGQVTARPRRSHNQWFIPLAAAAATLLIIGLVVVGRAQLGSGRHETPTNPGTEYSLDQLPPWENGATATTFPLPEPASTPVVFDVDATSAVPAAGRWRVVVYYAANPSRLCVIEILQPTTGTAHTNSIGCDGETGYVVTPVAQGLDWLLGTVPPPATKAEVTVNGQPVDVEVVTRAGMPRPVFFATLPFGGVHSLTWQFTDDDGRVVAHSDTTPRTPPAPEQSPTFRATPVSGIATFDEPPAQGAPAGSRRILHIYYAGSEHGFCSDEQVIRVGEKPVTASEDCGFDVIGDRPASVLQWLPASSGGSVSTTTFWGVMPAGATTTVIVTPSGKVPVQSAREDGMPTGVYAGSIDSHNTARVLYFLDSDGRVVAATVWRSQF